MKTIEKQNIESNRVPSSISGASTALRLIFKQLKSTLNPDQVESLSKTFAKDKGIANIGSSDDLLKHFDQNPKESDDFYKSFLKSKGSVFKLSDKIDFDKLIENAFKSDAYELNRSKLISASLGTPRPDRNARLISMPFNDATSLLSDASFVEKISPDAKRALQNLIAESKEAIKAGNVKNGRNQRIQDLYSSNLLLLKDHKFMVIGDLVCSKIKNNLGIVSEISKGMYNYLVKTKGTVTDKWNAYYHAFSKAIYGTSEVVEKVRVHADETYEAFVKKDSPSRSVCGGTFAKFLPPR